MAILDKIPENNSICAIEISFDSQLLPSTDPAWQPFYNSAFLTNDFTPMYASSGSLAIEEESVRTTAGTHYKQKINFRFPCTDAQRPERIATIMKANYIRLKTTTGLWFLVGRNDYFQNTKPILRMKANKQLCEFEVETQSIYPVSFSL